MADSDPLLDAVRQACAIGLWSSGVKMARAGAVTHASSDGQEHSYRVTERGRAVAPTVMFYADDLEWDCDCDGRLMPCAHIAAAIIARTQGLCSDPTSTGVNETTASAKLLYRFEIAHGALSVSRHLQDGDAPPVPLVLSLKDRIARGIRLPPFEPTHDDMAVDRGLYHRIGGDVPLATMRNILEALAHSEHVTLAGKPIRTAGEWLTPEAEVTDGPNDGVTLTIRIKADTKILAMGVGLKDGLMMPLADTTRFGLSFDKLPLVQHFKHSQLATVVSELLPELNRSLKVSIRTKRLPEQGKRLRPRLSFELSHEHGALFVLPLLVYGDPIVARIDSGNLVHLGEPAPLRDIACEKELQDRLRDELSLLTGRRVRFDGRDAVSFATKLERFKQQGSATAIGAGANHAELTPRVVATEAGIRIVFEVVDPNAPEERLSTQEISLQSVAEAHRDGLSIVGLLGGGFASLPADFLARHGQAILDLAGEEEASGRAGHLAIAAAREVCEALGAGLPGSLAQAAELLSDQRVWKDPELAPGFSGELRPYQRTGAAWLSFLRDAGLGGILADDMGLGKTVQVLSILKGRALIVSPKSVTHNWRAEIAKFRPDLSVSVYEGPNRRLDDQSDVILTSYGLLRQDRDLLADVVWDVAVLDEAQAIKNPESQVAAAAHSLRAKLRLSVSGTPIENRLDELWSLMRFAAPGLLGSRRDFRDRVAAAIVRGDREVAESLQKKLRPFLLRRTKTEVLPDLPPRSEAILYCDLSEQERDLYNAVRAATQKDVIAKLTEGGSPLAALEALLRLRQASCHSGLLPGQNATHSSKLERLGEALSELAAGGHRALVFSQWTSLLDRVEPELASRELDFVRLDGQTRDRQGVVEKFQAADGPPVMLLSLKAGGTGLNLTAADHVFILDPWWNPAVEEQAADRAHRIGQDKPVMVFRLVSKDTVEEKILALQEQKRRLSDGILGGGAGAGGGLTREELLELLA